MKTKIKIQNFKSGLRWNIFYFALSFFILIFALCIFPVAHAQEVHVDGAAAQTPAANPGAVVAQVYQFALLIGGLLAFGAIVYGGIKYVVAAGSPSAKSDGREWISGALWGLLLLLGAYLILHTINPNLTNLNLPTLEKLKPPETVAPAGEAGSGAAADTLTDPQARGQLIQKINGVLRACFPPSIATNCVSLANMRQATVDEVIGLKEKCACYVYVTGGTEPGHDVGSGTTALSHANGYKVDLRLSDDLNAYIEKFPRATPPTRSSDGAPQYRSPSGVVYARENNHWDVLVNTGGASGSF